MEQTVQLAGVVVVPRRWMEQRARGNLNEWPRAAYLTVDRSGVIWTALEQTLGTSGGPLFSETGWFNSRSSSAIWLLPVAGPCQRWGHMDLVRKMLIESQLRILLLVISCLLYPLPFIYLELSRQFQSVVSNCKHTSIFVNDIHFGRHRRFLLKLQRDSSKILVYYSTHIPEIFCKCLLVSYFKHTTNVF